ncbi:MAG: hypothetical protein AAF629_27810 [Chloroflexota bacterium]
MRKIIEVGCFSLAVLIVILTLAVLIGPYLDYQLGLSRISHQLEIEPTMPALTTYFESTFVTGTSKAEIDDLLYSSGATRIKVNKAMSSDCESIIYYVGYWPLNRLNFLLCYDQGEKLKSYTLFDEDF